MGAPVVRGQARTSCLGCKDECLCARYSDPLSLKSLLPSHHNAQVSPRDLADELSSPIPNSSSASSTLGCDLAPSSSSSFPWTPHGLCPRLPGAVADAEVRWRRIGTVGLHRRRRFPPSLARSIAMMRRAERRSSPGPGLVACLPPNPRLD